MLEGKDPVLQAFLGTLLTWGLTAAGAAMAFFISGHQRKLLDVSLGFAGGVMVAASFWSLLDPAIEMAQQSGLYGDKGQYAFAPVSLGFLLGALFVYGTDVFLTYAGIQSPFDLESKKNMKRRDSQGSSDTLETTTLNDSVSLELDDGSDDGPLESVVRQRKKKAVTRGRRGEGGSNQEVPADAAMIEGTDSGAGGESEEENAQKKLQEERDDRWKRILLLIVAVTVHNIPEGLAVGVAFGSIGKAPSATFESARNLAIGIGIQNFPEGLAVSLPLKTAGFSAAKSIWYGQLSGMVEPIAGVLGALLVSVTEPLLPYALAFAAGAMIYVVIDDIIPEAQTCGNGKLASWGAIVGFLIMMSLDLM